MGVARAVRYATALVAAVAAQSGASAQAPAPGDPFATGNDFYQTCSNGQNVALCLAYVKGSFEAFQYTVYAVQDGRGEKAHYELYCPGIVGISSTQQARDLLLNELRDEPQKRSFPTAFLFVELLKRYWPCQK